MTNKQKAIAGLIALAAAGGGSTVGAPAFRAMLAATCRVPEEKSVVMVPGGSETKLTLKRAVDIIGQNCDGGSGGGNGSMVIDKVEVKLTKKDGGSK